MAKTLADLRVQTRIYLDEAQQTDFLDAEVDNAINSNYHEVITAVISIFEDYYITNAETNTVANQQEYTLPVDFYKMKRVEINFYPNQVGSQFVRCLPINLQNVKMNISNVLSPIGGGTYYIIGNDIGLVPPVTQTGPNALVIWYIPMQSDLVNATDTVNLPYADRYCSLVTLAAAADLLRKGQQAEQVAAQYQKEFTQGIQIMKQELLERQDDDIRVIDDGVGEDIAFDKWLF